MPQLFGNEFIRQGILLAKEYCPALPSIRESRMNVPGIVRQILEVTELTQAQFAVKVGVSQGTISKWITEDQSPNKRQWDKVLRLAGRHPKLRHLATGAAGSTTVPVMGLVGAGAEIEPEFEQVPPEGLEEIELPFMVPPEIIAFRVQGDSMMPAYRNGDAVLVWREQRLDTESFIGEEAAVRTDAGRRYLKEIQQGPRRGLYNLNSHNATLMKGVRLEWVGEIYLIVRASQLRRVVGAEQRRQARKTTKHTKETSGMGRLDLGKE